MPFSAKDLQVGDVVTVFGRQYDVIRLTANGAVSAYSDRFNALDLVITDYALKSQVSSVTRLGVGQIWPEVN